jgi:hypothetical protein
MLTTVKTLLLPPNSEFVSRTSVRELVKYSRTEVRDTINCQTL